MTARQFQSLNQPVTAVCIPDYPADGDLPPQNGLYINSCLSSPAFYNLIQELYSEYERWNFALSFAEGDGTLPPAGTVYTYSSHASHHH